MRSPTPSDPRADQPAPWTRVTGALIRPRTAIPVPGDPPGLHLVKVLDAHPGRRALTEPRRPRPSLAPADAQRATQALAEILPCLDTQAPLETRDARQPWMPRTTTPDLLDRLCVPHACPHVILTTDGTFTSKTRGTPARIGMGFLAFDARTRTITAHAGWSVDRGAADLCSDAAELLAILGALRYALRSGTRRVSIVTDALPLLRALRRHQCGQPPLPTHPATGQLIRHLDDQLILAHDQGADVAFRWEGRNSVPAMARAHHLSRLAAQGAPRYRTAGP
jgi:ribonuclease HI